MAHPTPDDLALIALGEDVEGATLQHVGECRACFAEIEALQQVVAVGRSLGPDDHLVAPHPRVWQRIGSAVSDGRAIPLPGAVTLQERAPVVSPSEPDLVALGGRGHPPEAPPRRRGRGSLLLAAAAALVVGLGGGFGISQAIGPVPAGDPVTQLNALPRWSGANGTARVDSADGARTLVVTMELPPTVSVDGTFEVWMSDSQARDMVPMGTMTGGSARFPIPAGLDVATHPIVDISLEPRNDRDPAHSDISVVRGRLKV